MFRILLARGFRVEIIRCQMFFERLKVCCEKMWYSLKYRSECAHVLNLSAKLRKYKIYRVTVADLQMCRALKTWINFLFIVLLRQSRRSLRRHARNVSGPQRSLRASGADIFRASKYFLQSPKRLCGREHGTVRLGAAQQKWFVIAQLMLKIKGTKSSLGGVWHLCSCKTALLWNTAESFTVLRGTSERRAPGVLTSGTFPAFKHLMALSVPG